MIQIKTKGEALDLPSGFSIEIEDSNPIFNDRGSQSIPATVPATRRNIRLLDAPHRLDAGVDPNLPERTAEVVEGAYIRRGTMNITEAGKTEGITFNIGFDNSTAYSRWSAKKLSGLSGLPVCNAPATGDGEPIDRLLQELYRIYTEPDPQRDDFAIFPLTINNESTGQDADRKIYWEVLNVAGENGFTQPEKVKRLIDGELTEVTVPQGYMVSPFLRVWRVLELVFADLELEIEKNPFYDDPELSRLVVLNNAADSVCRGEIRYSDLMPDSTVEEFMNALWVRFGLVCNIDNNKKRVRLRFMKDILSQKESVSLDGYQAGTPKITYGQRQYVRLSAKTSIEGAAPSHERFEDFAKGVDLTRIHLGNDVDKWQNSGTRDDPRWSGDWNDSHYDDYDPWEDPGWEEPDPPEPDYPEPDDEQAEYHSVRSMAETQTTAGTTGTAGNDTFLAREFITGKWYRLDAMNNMVRLTSTSFFNWDPQPEGLTALDLSSDDEFVPIAEVSTGYTGTGNLFSGLSPLYLFGARHYHSYIRGSGDAGTSGDQTPLAFLFAYTVGGKTVGRVTPEGDDGKAMVLDDGTKPTVSLLFQFRDGLFARFWAGYDEILRHGSRSVEVKGRINKLDIPKLDLVNPYIYRGVRVLIDTMTYSLPAGREVNADLKLRTIQTQGDYDIAKEQNIPDFAAAARHLEWFLYSETFGKRLDTAGVRTEAVRKYREESGYQDHGTTGDLWTLGPKGARMKAFGRVAPTWQTDPCLAEPDFPGQQLVLGYKASISYDIYEIHDMTQEGGAENIGTGDSPIGEVSVPVSYQVVLYSRWVNDQVL